MTILDDLLWRDIVRLSPHVDLLIDVDARNDEEDAGPPGSTGEKTTQPEDDRSLVLLGLW